MADKDLGENAKKPIGFRIVERLGSSNTDSRTEHDSPQESQPSSVADRLRALRERNIQSRPEKEEESDKGEPTESTPRVETKDANEAPKMETKEAKGDDNKEKDAKERIAEKMRALREKKAEKQAGGETSVKDRLQALREKRGGDEGGEEKQDKPVTTQMGNEKIVRIEKDGDLERFLQSLSKKREAVSSPTNGIKEASSPTPTSFIVEAVSLEPQGLVHVPKSYGEVVSLVVPAIRSHKSKDDKEKDKAKVSMGTCDKCSRDIGQELQQLLSKQDLFIQNITNAASGDISEKTQKNVVPHLKKLAKMTKEFRQERNVIMDHLHHHIHAQLHQLHAEQKTLYHETQAKVNAVIDQIKGKQKELKDQTCNEFKEKYGSSDAILSKLQELLERCAKVWREVLETVNRFISTSQDSIEGANILRKIQLASAAFNMVAGELKEYNGSKDNCDSGWLFPLVALKRAQQLETAFAPVIAFLAVDSEVMDNVESLKTKYASIKSRIEKFNDELRDVERKRMKPSEKKVIEGSSVKDIVKRETKETSEDLSAKKTRLEEGLEVLEADRRKVVHQILIYKLAQYGDTLKQCKEGLVTLLDGLREATQGMRDDYSKYIAAKSLQASHGHEWLQSLRRTLFRRAEGMREAVCENIKRDLADANHKLESSPHLSQMRGYVAQMKGFVMVGNPVVQTLAGQIMPSKEQDSHSFHKILMELSNFVRTCEMIEQLEKKWLGNSWSKVYLDVVTVV